MPTNNGRERFAADELAIVLSHYDLGIIQKIQDFPRGSRKAPKLLLKTDAGVFLLKRRARGKDDPYKVAFAHALQNYLAQKNFPLPHLQGTRDDNNSMLQLDTGIYEVFEYTPGEPYDGGLDATYDAGKILGLYHVLLHDYPGEWEAPRGSYHDSPSVRASIRACPTRLMEDPAVESHGDELAGLTDWLAEQYEKAVGAANAAGLPDWEIQIVHSDWHPGNMLFRGSRVVAVIDYDAARLQQRVTDLANGLLQFSIIGGGDDPETWPDYFDESRMKRFLRGYDESNVISVAEIQIAAWLMIEALIAEAVLPIAAGGTFGKIPGFPFLRMIRRKAAWLEANAGKLAGILEE